MLIRECVCDAARPLIKALPYWRNGVVTKLGGSGAADQRWKQATLRHRVFLDRQAKVWYAIDLSDFVCRWHYYSGGFYDQTQRLLARRFLKPGDAYIDIGANRGVHALAVAKQLGPTSPVIAFEPNPTCHALLMAQAAINGLPNISCHNIGLSDCAGSLTLASSNEHTGTFSFREQPGAQHTVEVEVKRGDEVLDGRAFGRRVLVKIDTEGYEHKVLLGLQEFLKHPSLALSVEVTPKWLSQVGSSVGALFDLLLALEFVPFRLSEEGLQYNRQLRLERISAPLDEHQYDVFFVKRGFLTEAEARNLLR